MTLRQPAALFEIGKVKQFHGRTSIDGLNVLSVHHGEDFGDDIRVSWMKICLSSKMQAKRGGQRRSVRPLSCVLQAMR